VRDAASIGWIFGIYLELVEPAKRSAGSHRLNSRKPTAGS
jgi:hypothetical protein